MKYLKSIISARFIVLMCFVLAAHIGHTQQSISGPNCVKAGATYSYSISSFYSGNSNYSYSVTGGTVVGGSNSGTHVGPGVTNLQIIWTSAGGSVGVNSSVGFLSLNVFGASNFDPGTITSSNQTIDYNTIPATITGSPVSGGDCSGVSPDYHYQWQQSTGLSFVDIPGATGKDLSFSSPLTTTTNYKRISSESKTGNSAESGVVSVFVNDPPVFTPIIPGSISPSTQNANFNAVPQQLVLSGVSGGTGVYTYQWQGSPDNTTNSWLDIPGATTLQYIPNAQTSSVYYRVAVTSYGVTGYSAVAFVNVYPNLVAGIVNPDDISVLSGSSPGLMISTAPSGGNGIYAYQWQSSGDGTNFGDISSANANTFNPGGVTSNVWYRVKYSSNGALAYSNQVKVQVNPAAPDLSAIRVRSILKPGITQISAADALSDPADVSQVTQYFDGLGRQIQTVAKQQSPQQKDMVSLNVYDLFGRETYKYMPYVAGTADGDFKPTAIADQFSFNNILFSGEQYFYGQTIFENSPLSRPILSTSPGINWQGAQRGVTQQYKLNTIFDAVQIWTIGYNSGDLPQANGIYADGTLFKNISSDESGHMVIEYKNIKGQIILKKVQLTSSVTTDFSGWLSTYYVYDEFDNLRFVLPPKAVDASQGGNTVTEIANELCFRYEYDLRKRMIVKKVPGAGEVYMVYDARDRLVFNQDANMRLKSQWMATLYDDQNRPTTTGFIVYTGTRSDLQGYVALNTGNGNKSNVNSTTTTIANLSVANQQIAMNYVASQQISFTEGFSSVDGATFSATIDNSVASESIAVLDNPLPPGSNFTSLTVTYYDDYSSIGGTYNTQNNGQLDAGTNLYPETLPSQAAKIARGLTVGVKVRVLENPSDLSSSPMLSTVTFYDEKGRNIQTQSDNYKGGKDVVTSLYDFAGKILATYQSHNNPASQLVFDGVNTNNEYDNAGRLLRVYKTIHNDVAGKRLLVTNEYDELGKLKRKNLAPNYHGTGLESLEYEYNIRGWLLGMNRGYTRDDNSSHFFGFDIGYDKQNNNLIGNQAYLNAQFNGNISGTVWKSKGDGEKRKYDFAYDAANRLLSADFNQYSNGVFDKSAGIDFSTKELSYDANGNILTMKQWGLKLNTSVVIDRLQYQYANNSNKLLNVTDLGYLDQVGLAVQPFDNKLGDFTDKHITTSTAALDRDYDYDANGNLIRDWNKGIINYGFLDQPDLPTPGITYNHLNLPYQVSFGGVSPYDPNQTKGTIQYIYDALGTKLQKIVHENPSTTNGNKTIVTTTDYVGIFQYQNNQLQFFGNEEGRFRPTGGTVTTMCEAAVQVACQLNLDGTVTCPTGTQNPLYGGCQGTQISYVVAADYLIKDHLGNVRSMLTDEDKVNSYPPASMEAANATTEKLFYSKIDETDAPLPSGYPTTDHYTDPNQYAAKVSGSGNKVGPGITLKVMAGDKFNVRVTSWYSTNNAAIQSPVGLPVSDIVGALVSGISGLSKMTAGDLQTVGSIPTGIGNFLSGKQIDPGTIKPKAYLNWILFDEQFKYVEQSSGADAVPTEDDFSTSPDPNNKRVHLHQFQDLPITKNGYLYVYVSNETPNVDVYFDNLQLTHYPGPIVEENHYYPFGEQQYGVSYKAGVLGKIHLNTRKFQSQEFASEEFSDGTGLSVYEFRFRIDDPQIGRFFQIDPLSEKYSYNSTYAFSENKVTSHVELEGRESSFAMSQVWRSGGLTQSSADEMIRKFVVGAERAANVGKDVITIAGGVTLIVASGGTAAPFIAAASGGIAVAGGTAKLVLDAQGKYEESDQVPTTISGTAVFTINSVAGKDHNGDKLISNEVQATVEFTEGVLTFNFKDFDKTAKAIDKANGIISAISLTLDGSEMPEKLKTLLAGMVNNGGNRSNQRPPSDHPEDSKALRDLEQRLKVVNTRQ